MVKKAHCISSCPNIKFAMPLPLVIVISAQIMAATCCRRKYWDKKKNKHCSQKERQKQYILGAIEHISHYLAPQSQHFLQTISGNK